MKKKKIKEWKVKNQRPEEEYGGKAEHYYSEQVAENYAHSKPMQKMQESIAERAIEFLGIKKGRILDLGAGTGYSMKKLEQKRFEAVGIDVSNEMIKQASKKGIRVIKADMRSLPFKENEFDGAISISAFQWLLEGDKKEVRENIEKTAGELRRVLKPEASAVIQFYPKTEDDMKLSAKIFSKQGFETTIAEDNPKQKNKRKVYLIAKNKKGDNYISEIYEKAWKKKQEEKYKKAIQVLKKYLDEKGEVLDIGAGQGWFYEKLAKKGFRFKQVTAIEPDDRMMKKENEQKLNMKYENETFEEWSEKNRNKKYDYVFSFDSLHLLKKPRSVLNHLKKGGICFIAVPFHFENLLNQFNEKNIIEKGVIGKQEKDTYLIIKEE